MLAYGPAAGVAVFCVLYGIAALLYPGGSYDDPRQVGFDFAENYFCDLLRPVAHNGEPNAGYVPGMAAIAFVVPALALFWHVVVRHFPERPWLARTTRVAGSLSAAGTLLLFSPLHDRAVELGGGFGLVAFAAALFGLGRSGHRLLVAGGVAAALVSTACLVIWRSGVGVEALASLQKLAFATFFAWVAVASLSVRARSPSP